MEFSVKLAHLPAEIKFPERLNDRIRFDPARGQFIYRGFMTKCTYDELSTLSDDPEYHRALEQLFVLTSEEVAPHSPSRRLAAPILIVAVGVAALVVAAVWVMARHTTADPSAGGVPANAVSAASR
jgi:hypothetical protein